MRSIRLLGVVTLASLLGACGGKSDSDGAGGTGAAAGAGGGGGSGAVAGGGSGGSATGGSGAMGGAPGGSGGVGGVAGDGGAPGGGGAPCASLSAAYLDTLKKAKACNPFIDMEECTATVADALDCPCANTYVNPGNSEAMKTLSDLKYFWDAQKCGEGIGCPAIACEPPLSGSCTPDSTGSSGVCQDNFSNGS